VATTCNGGGSGYLGTRTDCASSGKVCSAGTCVTGCFEPPSSLRLFEIYIGDLPNVILKNTGATCMQLAGIVVEGKAQGNPATDVTLPDYTLDPGETVVLRGESGSGPWISIPENSTTHWARQGGYMLLCAGPCTTTASGSIIDAVAYQGTSLAPALPLPVAFTPPLKSTAPDFDSFHRVAYAGTYPNFVPSDWTTGPASTVEPTCPTTLPTDQSICFAQNVYGPCTYMNTTCVCGGVWSCG